MHIFESYEKVVRLLIIEPPAIPSTYTKYLDACFSSLIPEDISLLIREIKYTVDSVINNKAPGYDRVGDRITKNLEKNCRSLIK